MIAHVRVRGRFSVAGPAVSGVGYCLHLMGATHEVFGAWLPWIYKSRGREGRVPYLATSIHSPRGLLSFRLRASPFLSLLASLAIPPLS
jgi:hypothetical protein